MKNKQQHHGSLKKISLSKHENKRSILHHLYQSSQAYMFLKEAQ